MASRALTLVRGAGESSTVTLSIARNAVDYWERAVDRAVDALLDARPGDEVRIARWQLDAAHDLLIAARNRRDRLVAELQGLRWLWVANEGADG